MNVLVTGGAGFIGSNLSRHLLESGHRVTVLDDLSTGHCSHLHGVDVDLHIGSVTDPDAIDRAMDGVEAVVHLGALGSVPRSVANPIASHHANATGTIEILEAARRHGDLHTIVASSSSVYGNTETLPKTEDLVTRPMSPYAASKLATEWYALAFQHSLGLPTLAFRFFNVFGPWQRADHAYAPVIPAFVAAALAGRALKIEGDGHQSRDFTYVDTVCETIGDALERRVVSDVPVNLAFGSRVSLLDIVDLLRHEFGPQLAVRHVAPRAGDMRHTQADPSRLHDLFPSITPVDFADGLSTTIGWHREGLADTDRAA